MVLPLMWSALSAQGIPGSVVNACRGLYSEPRVYSEFGGEERELFTVSSGIVQGCPVSLWLYAAATGPVLRSLAGHQEDWSDEAIRAAADDVGAALGARSALRPWALSEGGNRGGFAVETPQMRRGPSLGPVFAGTRVRDEAVVAGGCARVVSVPGCPISGWRSGRPGPPASDDQAPRPVWQDTFTPSPR